MSAQRSQNGSGSTGQARDEGDVALLIDYENLQVSLKRHFDLTTPKMSLIIQEAQEHGRLVLARAYAPWTSPDLSIDAENLYRQGIDLVYVPTRKNSADVRMAVDAVETCGQSSNIRTYVIVTGDGDLIHPITYLRQQGRTVVVIGVDAAMSRMLSAAADSVLLYERDLDPSVRRRVQSKSAQRASDSSDDHRDDQKTVLTPTSKEYPPAEEAFRMVQDALARRGNGEPVLFQELGHWLSQDHNLKPRVWYGVPFSTFLDAAQQHGHVKITTSGGNSYAALPDSMGTDDALLDDDISEDDGDDGSSVRLESLRPEERRDLFNALRELQDSKRNSYLSFRLILNHLVSKSILPRLSEWQIRRLLNDLADRTPPILVRGQKTGKTPGGRSYTFSTFTLTDDQDVLREAELTDA